ncbi:hypothetical protein SAMN03097699_1930 [Flavobacteriaceae bacterium MAR_2010_188]|nr:hypothetical protein SAMN03097699_1930 [Flavobacteriaceae bacterium MAR_2010_188]
MTETYIKERIKSAPQLDFGTIFSESIDLFKKSIVHGFVMQLIVMIATIPFFLILYVPLIVSISQQSDVTQTTGTDYSQFLSGFSILSLVFFLVGVVIIGTLVMAIRVGFIRMLKMIDEDVDISTKELFYFFKGKYLFKLFLLLLITILIGSIAMLLFILPIFYVIVPISFMMVVFALNPEFTTGEIVKFSFLLGNKKWLISFGLIIVATVLSSLIGFVLCGIGILFTAPFVYHPVYIIYKKVVGFEEITKNDDFRNSLKKTN